MRVFVAMSGGVDSSVAAALLLEQGHDVTGVTMQLWPSSDDEGGCCSVERVRDAKRVCDLLGIPHYTLNYRETCSSARSSTPFASEYAAGRTPEPVHRVQRPCQVLRPLGARVRSGCRVLSPPGTTRAFVTRRCWSAVARTWRGCREGPELLPLSDDPHQLAHVLFPVGELAKTEVRAFAERLGLPVAAKPESQDVCFAPEGPAAIAQAPGARGADPRRDRRWVGSCARAARGDWPLHDRPETGPRSCRGSVVRRRDRRR